MVTLEASKLFSQLSPPELRALRRVARERTFAAGQEIFKEGDSGDGVYVVREGLVEISGLVDQKGRLVFSQVGPGDIFGEMAVIENKPRSACAVARRDTTVYFMPRAEMLALVERSPALALALLREISHRLREFNRQYLREVLQAERLAIVGRFARSIVHDLKNPLNIIGLTAEMAGMDRATPEMRQQAAARIRKQVERISELISEILDFTQGSQSDFVLAPADYGAFVTQLLEELGPEAGLKSVTLELENPPPVGRAVHPPETPAPRLLQSRAQCHRCHAGRGQDHPALPGHRDARWSPRSRTAGGASRRRSPGSCSRSSPRMARRTAPAWASPSASGSSRTITAGFGAQPAGARGRVLLRVAAARATEGYMSCRLQSYKSPGRLLM